MPLGKLIWTALRLMFLAALVSFAVLAWPVYQFEAHQGDAPMLPFGWVDMPEGAAPQTQDVLDPNFSEAGVRALKAMATWRADIGAPALSAAIGHKGQIVWRGAVGWADLGAKRAATPDTQFRIGSTSKAVTATALARLVDRGVLDLDVPIGTYLGPLPNAAWQPITPRMLASHMAGIPHYKENGDWVGLYRSVALGTHYDTVRSALDVFDESPLLFEPGTDFHYSTLGTVLLGAAMGAADGTSYRELISREVLEPAGMTATIVAPRHAPRSSQLAQFYHRKDGQYRVWRPVDLSHRLPGGGFASTPSDLVRMGLKQLDDAYISPETRKAFWTPQTLSSGEVNEQDYAIGWRWREWDVEGVGIARNANHGGVSRGSQCWLLIFPDFDLVLAFTMNGRTDQFGTFGGLYAPLLQAFVPATRNAPVPDGRDTSL